MDPVPYNRSIMGQTYLLRVFTPKSIALTFAGVITMVVVFGFIAAVGFFCVMFIYQAYLRFGKPPGYDEHVVRRLFEAKTVRPATLTFVRPVKEDTDEKEV